MKTTEAVKLPHSFSIRSGETQLSKPKNEIISTLTHSP